ncbi:MAG: alpha-amylase family glycosyl hydrolase, partial [Planctomycetota bacterium]
MSGGTADAIQARLQRIYGGDPAVEVPAIRDRIQQLIEVHRTQGAVETVRAIDQTSAMLITYADQVSAPGQGALTSLEQFLNETGLSRSLSHIHFLPFFPYSSDDGFSVIDFRQLDAVHGNWEDVRRLAEQYGLMFDLVLNHVSSQSDWFQDYLQGQSPCDKYFIEVDPQTDVSQVTRPRALPLLTAVDTSRGRRYVWTTFSADQIDLNYANPSVLIEMIDVLLFFVSQGAQLIRLDAIAYLWKTPGTSCIHLPETHEVVKLLRDVLEAVPTDVRLITETNVPHAENVSYFGEGDEAHLVYQFSLPPLLLEAMLSQDASALEAWMSNLAPPPAGCTFFNFTASHDGIGVRPLEGLVSASRLQNLVEAVRARGGRVGMKTNPDGTESPYELNITYFSALADPQDSLQVRRFLTTQAVMLGLQGLPGIYFHSLVG